MQGCYVVIKEARSLLGPKDSLLGPDNVPTKVISTCKWKSEACLKIFLMEFCWLECAHMMSGSE